MTKILCVIQFHATHRLPIIIIKISLELELKKDNKKHPLIEEDKKFSNALKCVQFWWESTRYLRPPIPIPLSHTQTHTTLLHTKWEHTNRCRHTSKPTKSVW